MAGHRNPRCWSSCEFSYSIILPALCEEDVPVVQGRERPSHRGVWSSLLLSSPPMCDRAEMETRPWGLQVGTCLERVGGILGTFRSNEEVRFIWSLMLVDHSLRAAGSEVSLQFTQILIQLLKSLAVNLTARKQVRIGWEWNPGSVSQGSVYHIVIPHRYIVWLTSTMPEMNPHIPGKEGCSHTLCDPVLLRISVSLGGEARRGNRDNWPGTVLMQHRKILWENDQTSSRK